jgi:hypothetical protein
MPYAIPSQTNLNLTIPINMKKAFNLLLVLTNSNLIITDKLRHCKIPLLSLLGCFVLTFSSTSLLAQQSELTAPGDLISTEDLSEVKWKSSVEYAAILTIERNSTIVLLADPNLKSHELGLYTGYSRMLAYMQEELNEEGNNNELALNNYKRILTEMPEDAIMKNMHPEEFATLYSTLVTKLIQPE